jgi:hypothetical protein
MRKPRIEAYRVIVEQRKLGHMLALIYDLLYKFGPMTMAEVWFKASTGRQISVFRPRFSDLERYGVIEPVGERACFVTRIKSMLWDVTDTVPVIEAKKERGETSKIQAMRTELNKAAVDLSRANREIVRLKALLVRHGIQHQRQTELSPTRHEQRIPETVSAEPQEV